ncbi:amidase [Streptosporangium lutulentum]|uniref:Amidase n=1 Tax=Streptosporangium lutulentum TaxID=1461250 RepID=A0ABT9QK71_9ACTN|nr:amidase family protein [Streptosporangium lutulentum]MDP9847109.1 amidase [Streptosporangium lutulentum]
MSAVEIAEAVRRGKVAASMVVEEHLDAIAARDGRIGAFRKVRAEQALAEARAVQGREDLAGLPLAGVPIAIKDNVAIRGEASRNGSAATPDTPAAEDHPVVARLRAAGAVVVGITNVPELCLVGFSDSVYGVTRNPWDLGRTPGGSSGGSAAAVASGMVPLAHGNDALGSLRIPAACCGVVSIKPGQNVVPSPEHDWYGMSENGPLATTVADLALALAVMAGDMSLTTPGETESLQVGSTIDDYPGGLIPSEPMTLRIAVAPMPLPSGFSVDAEFQNAVTRAAEVFGAAGHTVVDHGEQLPAWLGTATVATWFTCARTNAAGLDPRRLERRTRSLAKAGRLLARLGMDGSAGRDRWRAHGADQWFGNADVLVTPTLATIPPGAERWGRRGLLANVRTNVTYAPVTGAWNMAGWPAMSIPYGLHSSGLPIGVQLVAAPGGESQLLALAGQLEAAHPWPRHAPLG